MDKGNVIQDTLKIFRWGTSNADDSMAEETSARANDATRERAQAHTRITAPRGAEEEEGKWHGPVSGH